METKVVMAALAILVVVEVEIPLIITGKSYHGASPGKISWNLRLPLCCPSVLYYIYCSKEKVDDNYNLEVRKIYRTSFSSILVLFLHCMYF